MPKALHNSGRRDRRIKYRGVKRDVHKEDFYVNDITTNIDDWQAILSLAFSTAWSPPLELFEYLAINNKKLKISIEYDEGWCRFSWMVDRENGEITGQSEFNDAYYGRGEQCTKCWGEYDPDNQDDWWSEDESMCTYCEEEILSNKEIKWES